MLKLCTVPLLESRCQCVSQDELLTWTYRFPLTSALAGLGGWPGIALPCDLG